MTRATSTLALILIGSLSTPPAAGEAIHQETLPNGARLILQERPGCGTYAIALAVRGGRAEDREDQIGLTEVLGRLLLRGTSSRSGDEQALEVERTGSSLDVVVGATAISLWATGPAPGFGPALEVVMDAALQPRLDAADLASEIALARQRLRRSLDHPSSELDRAALPLIFPDHPLGRIPHLETFPEGVTVETVRRAHAERFTGRRMVLTIVGEVGPAARAEARSLLAGAPGGTAAPSLTAPRPLAAEVAARARRRTAQPELLVAMPTAGVAEADEPAMDLLAHILGGFEERLSTEIRVKRGWAYWLGVADLRLDRAGMFGIRTAVPEKRLEEAAAIIKAELLRIASEAPSVEEVDRSRRFLLTARARAWQRSAGRAGAFISAAVRGHPLRTYDETAARYAAVTPEAIRDLAARLRESSALALVTLH